MSDASLRLRAYLGDVAARKRQGVRRSRIGDLLQDGCLPLPTRFARRAHDLADALMHRARRNVLVLIERLKQGGFVFRYDGYLPPTPNARQLMDAFEKKSGLCIPLVFRAWVEIVGRVSLMGSHPAWPHSTYHDLGAGRAIVVDPLVVDWSPEWLAPAWKGWRAGDEDYHFRDRLALDFAPDPGHKANCSSSGSYYLPLSDTPSIDALVVNEDSARYRRTFLEHLRDAFRRGGFPGWRGHPDEPQASLRGLTRGLEKL